MKSASQAISKVPKQSKLAVAKEGRVSNDMKAFYEKFNKGEFISPKLQKRYESETISFAQQLFTEKPNLSKKEAALEILQNMPDNIPSTAFSKLLETGMKEWMSFKGQAA